jgi:hypothetical protein
MRLACYAQAAAVPIIKTHPQSQFVLAGSTPILSVTVTNPYWAVLSTNSWGSSGPATNLFCTSEYFGTVQINYDFYAIPDTLRAYYEDVRIFDSGEVSGSGNFLINYGPGASTNLVIVVNEDGNPDPDTAWDYTALAPSHLGYQWFKNGVEVPFATNSVLGITNVQPADAGNYTVTITNAMGATNSKPAFVSLAPPPSLRILLTTTNTVLLSWATNYSGFVLEQIADFDSPNWIDVPGSPNTVGDQNQMTLEATEASQYFRLRYR